MTTQEVASTLRAMPADQKLRVLALLAHNLTVAARAAYPGQVEPHLVTTKLPALNELQHTVTGRLMHLAAGDENGFPDDAFLEVLFEKAKRGDCEPELLHALDRSCSAKW